MGGVLLGGHEIGVSVVNADNLTGIPLAVDDCGGVLAFLDPLSTGISCLLGHLTAALICGHTLMEERHGESYLSA